MRALLLSLLLLAPLAAGEHGVGRCGSYGSPMLGVIQVSDGTAEHTFYVDDRNYLLGNGIWIYVESNGVFTPFTPVTYSVTTGDPGPPQVYRWWEWVGRAVSVTVSMDNSDPHDNLQRGGTGVLSPYTPDEYDDDEICTDPNEAGPDLLLW